MESENETRPLLSTFEGESWRSRTRKRCMRIPSEITITGVILGLFLVVVTLLIVFENVETEEKDDLTLDNKLLASPFKYNKKAEDMSWQDKKSKVKDMKHFKEEKWDNVNKGWKKFPDITGSIKNGGTGLLRKKFKDTIQTTEASKMDEYEKILHKKFKDSSEIPEVPKVDEYGKEVDDSLEELFDLQMADPRIMKLFNKDIAEIRNLLHTKTKWKEIDDGWKTLSEQGWSDRQIRAALFKAMKEEREKLMDADSMQTPDDFEQMWDNIIENWKIKVKEGREPIQVQKGINDEWGNDMAILQSPKSSFKKFIKADEGWKKLSDLGWKNKEIEEAVIEAWEKHKNASMDNRPILQSPMNIPGLWGKTKGFINSIFHKGMSEQKSQKEINDEWAKKFNFLQSPMSSYKKYKKYEDLKKKHSKDDWKDKTADDTENENNSLLQSPMKFEDFMEDIMERLKDKKGIDEPKSQMEINDEWANDFSVLKSPTPSFKNWNIFEELRKKYIKDGKTTDYPDYEADGALKSPLNFEDFMKDVIEIIKERKKGNKEAEKQKNINDEWKDGVKILRTAKLPDKKWKQVDDHWRTLIEHERNTLFGRNDGDVTKRPRDYTPKQSMPLDNFDWGKIKNEWEKITDQGGKDEDIKEAVLNAWKDSKKLLQSSLGHNNMKWKKVNEGWKKLSNKS